MLTTDEIKRLSMAASGTIVSLTTFSKPLTIDEMVEMTSVDDELTIDLFEHPELWPDELSRVIDKYTQDDDLTVWQLAFMHAECLEVGYTFDYGLDCIPFNLKPYTT
jgi:hypothetical protein